MKQVLSVAQFVLALCANPFARAQSGGTPAMPGPMRDITSLQLSQHLAPSWNLAPSREAIGSEAAWDHRTVTKALLDTIKAAAFNSVRIPLSWTRYADANDHLRADRMARATEVVNQARNAGLHVIIDIHSDSAWMQPTYARQAAANARIGKLWTQIAHHFRTYDDHLLFAAHHEVMGAGDHHAPTFESCTVQNSFNQTFVNAVRATGGNNAVRHLVVQGYNGHIDHTCDFLAVPTDTVAGRLMVEVHCDGPARASGGHVTAQFNRMRQRFIDGLGVPVLVGELPAAGRLSVDGVRTYRTPWDPYIASAARAHGVVPTYSAK
ncbi:MAG TPA: glycoside hydrolase family 5 protein [Albitalea sp.]|uniref:glycoside hydrolase family 5 protein n=1 Tax=Piscinibacter sp. TaxID=1903157 RepID=UPI002ED0FD92